MTGAGRRYIVDIKLGEIITGGQTKKFRNDFHPWTSRV